jgi:hypothetical protein
LAEQSLDPEHASQNIGLLENQSFNNSSGSLAIFAAIRRASSFVSSLATERWF